MYIIYQRSCQELIFSHELAPWFWSLLCRRHEKHFSFSKQFLANFISIYNGCLAWMLSMDAQHGCSAWMLSMDAQHGCLAWMLI